MVTAKCIEYVVSRRELTRPTVPCACTGNYGTGGLPLDALFGTLRDTLSGKDKLYDGACTSTHEAKYIAEAGANETAFKLKPASEPQPQRRYRLPKFGSLNPIPKTADALYLVGVLGIFATLLWALGCHNASGTAFKSGRTCPSLRIGECDFRTWVPLLVSVGPVAWGALLLGSRRLGQFLVSLAIPQRPDRPHASALALGCACVPRGGLPGPRHVFWVSLSAACPGARQRIGLTSSTQEANYP
jgi:hypothetical protein